jgi:exonuclease SbcD
VRILHTSDWHLGQTFHQFERSYEHERFLNWLLQTILEKKIDLLLIAGYVYDTANPSADSQRQLFRFLSEARQKCPGLKIILTAGNHDSPARIDAPSPLLELFNATVVGQVLKADQQIDWDKIIVPIHDSAGEVRAWCLAVPFLRPSDVPRVSKCPETDQDPYTQGIAAFYREAYERALAKRAPGQAIIALGHCHVAGGRESKESERRILIGGVEALSDRIFDPGIAYVALGHLHLAQIIGGNPTRRYSGSPLPMSFSEIGYTHQVLCFDLVGEAAGNFEAIPVPRAVDLIKVPEAPAPLVDVLVHLRNLKLAKLPPAEWPYLMVRVKLEGPEPTLRAEIEAALEGAPVRLVRIESSYGTSSAGASVSVASVDEIASIDTEHFFKSIYQKQYGAEVPSALMEAFREILHPASQAGDSGR